MLTPVDWCCVFWIWWWCRLDPSGSLPGWSKLERAA